MIGLKDFDMEKVGELCINFSDKAEEIDANTATMLLAATSLFVAVFKTITIADENGKKYPRMREMIVPFIDAFNADYPIDSEK